MTWIPLKERIDNLPLVLAGPILRRTDIHSVTVWVALKESRTVTLKIFDIRHKLLLTGSQKTIRLGTYLHIVAVTAKSSSSDLLSYGENYLYNLDFGNEETLNQAGVLSLDGSIKDIAYPRYDLPTFALVPNDINDVRIIHGSCRKPHGESLDALAALDKIIREALEENPKKRPHQLFLTGDQIYVDDVADTLLFTILDASQTLLGWTEPLPDVNHPEELNPGQRNDLATHTAGLTASLGKMNKISNIAKSHLFTLGEFLAMYLFAWSDVLWTKEENLPEFEDVYPNIAKSGKRKTIFEEELRYLQEFRSTLKDIRRALANVPTYMIFDDHEMTDDWFLNMAWCDRVLKQPLGKRVLQNGLLAYALCQGWGNTPDQFENNQPGETLLKATESWSDSCGTNPHSEQEIARAIGFPTLAEIKKTQPRQLPHKEHSLKWNYTVTSPNFEVIVLDTRTWRGFPGDKDFDFPALLSAEGCDEQISKISRPKDAKITIVVSPSPVIGLPFLETVQKIAKNMAEKLGTSAWGFDPEAWGLEETAVERLLTRLALRALPEQKNRVIILSGDVHYSFAVRLQYAATRPFQNSHHHNNNVETHHNTSPHKPSLQTIIAQFTSSSLKNEAKGFGGSHSLHTQGFVPFAITKALPTVEVLGWENPEQKSLKVGDVYTFIDQSVEQTVQCLPLILQGSPAKLNLVNQRSFLRSLQINKKPEWWYRIDFLSAELEDINEPQDSHSTIPYSVKAPLPGQNRKLPLEQYLAMAKNYRDYTSHRTKGKEIVGLNNIGEITFEFVEGKERAVQTLWWRLESWEKDKLLEPFPLTRCEVSLNFADPDYPMDEVLKEVEF
ncbi:hypothetical protein WA1_09485 [Scytonema hofmannii PCC 7110]|uniref:PhoD-like phosphatase n=1 Tax=Scytonema hofmannii PCC 7110 TaxID=128403 RepID=A0A139WRB1_9CYAN|nr:hypothetical protein [Scytonema hofmannii]KYC34972.1 hypothetical protein WA1_09485 [Scytonema hofmannii PCC 7110]